MNCAPRRWTMSEVTLTEVMVSEKGRPSSAQIESVKPAPSTEAMESEKGTPSAFQIEDVKEVSSVDAAASSMDLPSNATTEEAKSLADPPPDGGLFAWLQVLGGWILVLNSR